MAKKSKIAKNEQRKVVVARYQAKRLELKKAVVGKTTPLEATSRDASAWLEQLNRWREQLGGKAVGWSSQASVACKEHVEYLKANKDQRGPGKEDTQLAGKPAFTAAGRSFAGKALVWTRDKDPKKALEQWLVLPGYRDVLLNRNLDTVGIYVDDVDEKFKNQAFKLLLWAGLICGFIAISLLVLSRNIIRTLGGDPAIASAITQRIAAGDLATPVDCPADDKTSLLANIRHVEFTSPMQAMIAGHENLARHTDRFRDRFYG